MIPTTASFLGSLQAAAAKAETAEVAFRLEAVQITENPAKGIAEIAIVIGNAQHQLVRGVHVFAEVD